MSVADDVKSLLSFHRVVLYGYVMTIYSQHANRGEILATHSGPAGVTSSTVTSVDDSVPAAPIVNALNRISACAAAPLTTVDDRGDRAARYPAEHLAALTERSARVSLLDGAHSLWYEHVTALLHQALTDLDDAVSDAPPPVRLAITAELAAEQRRLHGALAEHTAPFVLPASGVDGLSADERAHLNLLEQDLGEESLKAGVADLRLLLDVHRRCANATLIVEEFTLTDDPWRDTSARYFLNVAAPLPGGRYDRDSWAAEICRWIPMNQKDEDSTAIGEPVLRCTRTTPPTAEEVIELLNHSGGQQTQLATWAKTSVGEALAGTTFVVTERHTG